MPDKDIRSLVGQRIRDLRKAKGLSQESLAERAGFQTSYIGETERGKRNISLTNLGRIAEGLAVEVKELFLFDDDLSNKSRSLSLNELIRLLEGRDEKELHALITILNTLFDKYEYRQ